jgi:hypothetical protein
VKAARLALAVVRAHLGQRKILWKHDGWLSVAALEAAARKA